MAKHPGGRPKKYTPELIKKLVKKLEEYIKKTELPKVDEFLLQERIPNSMFYSISEFSESMEFLKKKQKIALIDRGLNKKYHTGMARFILNANHGMVETHNQNIKAEVSIDARIKKMSKDEIEKEINDLQK